MANIYIPAASFANPPGRKVARLLRDNWPQIEGFTSSPDEPIVVNGATQPPGYVVHTSNVEPDPDEAAIVADALALADGTQDPPLFGVAVPMVATAADLPAQPPNLATDTAYMAVVRQNPDRGLWFYVQGAGWFGPIAP